MTQADKIQKVATISSAVGGLGLASGIGYGLYKKKKFWPVVGIALALSLIGSVGSAAVANIVIKTTVPTKPAQANNAIV